MTLYTEFITGLLITIKAASSDEKALAPWRTSGWRPLRCRVIEPLNASFSLGVGVGMVEAH